MALDILKNYGGHNIASGMWSGLPGSFIFMSKKIVFQHKNGVKGFYKEFNLLGLSDALSWINGTDGTCKMGILTAVKSAS